MAGSIKFHNQSQLDETQIHTEISTHRKDKDKTVPAIFRRGQNNICVTIFTSELLSINLPSDDLSTSSKNNAFAIPESLITQAEMGNFEAQCRLALLYAAPPSDADSESVQNFERAFYWNSRAVNDHTNPSPEAIAALGLARFSGKGCEADSAAAFVLLSRAADLGLVDAQAIVSDMLFHGLGVDIDLKRAFYYSKLAADQNHKLSILKLASMYLMGDGVMPDVDQAKIYARNATGEEIDFVNPGQWLHDKMDQLMDEEVNAK
ncbi:hypothetical protein HK100_003167 [Physocladia obscura]|uniref:Sel1 repeat family protein n=1 Tax=Physocladia obscura TaxID=109957 RepID=A0AAD5SWI6_9FUNG|nr:hypothetical protein HK100_003167 [Physocladia obscura]